MRRSRFSLHILPNDMLVCPVSRTGESPKRVLQIELVEPRTAAILEDVVEPPIGNDTGREFQSSHHCRRGAIPLDQPFFSERSIPSPDFLMARWFGMLR